MHKDELLQLHSLLCQVKRFFENSGLPTEAVFDEYEDMEVSPQHIHKSKTDHKRAVFMLGKSMSQLVMNDDPEHQARLMERFSRMAEGKSGLASVAQRAAENTRPEPKEEPEGHLPAFAIAALQQS